MPNWCYNNVDITATTDLQKELLQRIVDRADDQGVFDTIRPLPEALKDTTSPAPQPGQANYKGEQPVVDGCNNWYDWQVHHWGTKWDVDPIHEEYDGETLSMSFDSAWSPPTELYAYLKEQGFEVSANYYEPGMDFAGQWTDGDDFVIENVSDLARQDTDTLSTQEYDILETFGIWEEVAMWDADEEMDDSNDGES